MNKRKLERAYEMVKINMAMAEITRALNMTKADWRDFIVQHSTEFYCNFSGIREYVQAKIKKDALKRQLAKALRPVDFIKLTEKGIAYLKNVLIENHTSLISRNCFFDFQATMEMLPYAMRATNGKAYITIRAKEHGGYRGDSTVVVNFPNAFIYLLGYADVVDTIPADTAIDAARIKIEGELNCIALSKDIDTMLQGLGHSELVIPVTQYTMFSTTHDAIAHANEKLGLHINQDLFLNEQVNNSIVTVRPNPNGPVEGVFSIRTRIEK